MPYCKHKKGKHYNTEKNNWDKGYSEFIKSNNPWEYDFLDNVEEYTEKTHCEQSILSQLIFINLFNKNKGISAEIDKCGQSITVNGSKISKDFLFDIMHNPKHGCQPYQQGKKFCYINETNQEMMFKNIYHTIGNFAPVPRTIITKNYGPSLQQIHEYLNELWPWFLKFMQDNWDIFPTKVHELMTFKEYIQYSCQQMYFDKVFNELYQLHEQQKNKKEHWDMIIKKLSSKGINDMDKLISFDGLFTSKEGIEEIDKRIKFLIELRGRYIISILQEN